jgi:cytochrome c-type biogenesis protein
LAFVAGVLSVLSPCVLPLVPIVMAAAASAHRYGPIALGAGVVFSFALIGLFVSTIGFAIGLDGAFFRVVAACLLTLVGIVLLIPAFQQSIAVAVGPVSGWMDDRFGSTDGAGIFGQLGVGLVLGAVWSPCVGPTLGAASLLAAQGKDLQQVFATLISFGLGAALPLLLLGTVSRELLQRSRSALVQAGSTGKYVLGVSLALTGIAILTGSDKALEAQILTVAPSWLTQITTRF